MALSSEEVDRFTREALSRGVSQSRINAFCDSDGRNADGSCDFQRLWNLEPDTAPRDSSGRPVGYEQLSSGQWRNLATGDVSRTYGHTALDNPAPVEVLEERNVVAGGITDPWLAEAIRTGRVALRVGVDARGQSTPVVAIGDVQSQSAQRAAEYQDVIARNPGDEARINPMYGMAAPIQRPMLLDDQRAYAMAGMGGALGSPLFLIAGLAIYFLWGRK